MNAYPAKAVNEDVSRRMRSGVGGSARRRGRLVARVKAAKLDRALAAGVSPGSSRALALRAEALTSLRTRRALGHTLERLLAERPDERPLGPRISPRRERLDATRADLGALALRLEADQPTDARGVARVRRLLSDGCGPLLWARSPENLGAAVRAARAGLEPRPDQPRARETR